MRFLARLLIRGHDASYIRDDLDTSYVSDVARGKRGASARWRYSCNVTASVWRVWTNQLRGLLTQGIGLDFRLGLRMLAKQRLITAVAGLTLAVGIPASLTLVHGLDVLYGDLPIEDGDRVVGIRYFDRAQQRAQRSTLQSYAEWGDLTSFGSVAAVRSYSVNVNSEGAEGAPVLAAELTASSFDVLRARPLRGRVFRAADEFHSAPDVVVIGEELWAGRFERDPDIVGSTVRLGRSLHTVIGVMPSAFKFPLTNQIWLPMRSRARDFPAHEGPRVLVFGRLADGIALEAAEREIAALLERQAGDDPERFDQLAAEVVGMPALLLSERDDVWNEVDVLVVQALVFGLLLIVCGNVGTLFLARTAARSSELTIRTALGASRSRILTQLFVEALVLAVAATGLGLLAANAIATRMGQMIAARVDTFTYWWVDFSLTPRLAFIALGLAALCAAVIGVLPALSTTRLAIQANLKKAAHRGGSARFGVGPSLLIVSEIALSVGFLALGVTALRSRSTQAGSQLGLDPARWVVGTFTVPQLDPADSPNAADSTAWSLRVVEAQRTLLAELSEDPAVLSVAMGRHVPGVKPGNRGVILERPPVGFEPIERDILIPRVATSFFASLNRPTIAGRDFSPGDVAGPPDRHRPAVIVNESFVRDVLGNRNAVGQRFRYEPQGSAWPQLGEGDWFEIVGVVESFGTNPQNSAWDAAIYHPLAPGEANPIRYAVNVMGDPVTFLPRFRQIVAVVDPEATVHAGVLSASIRTESLIMRTVFLGMIAIASISFLLSATGLYALMAFTVSQRTREIGIRASLGAGTLDIVSAIARRAAVQIAMGLVLGVGWGWRLLTNTNLGFDPSDVPMTLALTALVAGGICVLACTRPTLRGVRVLPVEALRES